MLRNLPLELLLHIIQYLQCKDITRLSGCSKELCRLNGAEYDKLWYVLTYELTTIPYKDISEYNGINHTLHKTWYEAYMYIMSKIGNTSLEDEMKLIFACWEGHVDLVRIMLKNKNVDPIYFDGKALIKACECGYTDIVKILLSDSRVDPCVFDNDAFVSACEYGRIDIVRMLLSDDRVDPACQSNLPIIYACKHGHVDIAKLLLSDVRVDPTDNDNEALESAIGNGCVEIVKLLREHKKMNF